MKKILVTGGAGFIGLHLARFLINKDYHVDIVDDFSQGKNDEALQQLAAHSNCQVYNINLLNNKEVSTLQQAYDLAFHFAAIIGVERVISMPYRVLTENVRMTENLIAQLAKTSSNTLQKLVFASTSEIYAGTLQHYELQIPTPETTPITFSEMSHPRSTYMMSKAYGEAICHYAPFKTVSLRLHNIYGPRMGLSHVIPELMYKAWSLQPEQSLPVFSVDHQRTFSYIDDALAMIWEVSQNSEEENLTVNIGNETPIYSIGEVAATILAVMQKKNKIVAVTDSHASPSRRCPDMSYASNYLNSQAKYTLVEGIKQTYDWYRKVFSELVV